jgi:hypothetical protein
MDGLQYTFNRRMMTEHWVGALDLEFCGIGYGSFGDMMGFLGLGVLGLRLLRLSCISCRDGMLSATSGVWAWDWHGIGMGLAWNGDFDVFLVKRRCGLCLLLACLGGKETRIMVYIAQWIAC